MINLQYMYLKLFFVLGLVTALLCLAARRGRRWGRVLQTAALAVCLQLGLVLIFVGSYVLCVKNGYMPSLSAMGVAFFPISVLVYYAFWHFSALARAPWSLIPHTLYTLLLLTKPFPASMLYNPLYAFLGAGSSVAFLTAFLPLFAAALGRSVAMIDKRR